MITIADPKAMIWHPFPLPKADAVHPDCRIIVFNWDTIDECRIEVLWADKEDWRNTNGDTFCIYDTTGEHWWCWHRRFNEETQ